MTNRETLQFSLSILLAACCTVLAVSSSNWCWLLVAVGWLINAAIEHKASQVKES